MKEPVLEPGQMTVPVPALGWCQNRVQHVFVGPQIGTVPVPELYVFFVQFQNWDTLAPKSALGTPVAIWGQFVVQVKDKFSRNIVVCGQLCN